MKRWEKGWEGVGEGRRCFDLQCVIQTAPAAPRCTGWWGGGCPLALGNFSRSRTRTGGSRHHCGVETAVKGEITVARLFFCGSISRSREEVSCAPANSGVKIMPVNCGSRNVRPSSTFVGDRGLAPLFFIDGVTGMDDDVIELCQSDAGTCLFGLYMYDRPGGDFVLDQCRG